jgi:hypothetical protein
MKREPHKERERGVSREVLLFVITCVYVTLYTWPVVVCVCVCVREREDLEMERLGGESGG